MILAPNTTHPEGEEQAANVGLNSEQVEVDTYDGKVFVEWDADAAVTPLAQLPFFIQFLKLGGRFEPWVDDCPLTYTSSNAPTKKDVLGSLFFEIGSFLTPRFGFNEKRNVRLSQDYHNKSVVLVRSLGSPMMVIHFLRSLSIFSSCSLKASS